MVGHDVGMPAGFQDEDFLLKCGNIIVCKEEQERKGRCRGGVWGKRSRVPRGGEGVWVANCRVLFSPGSIFTIFTATRSPVTLSRAL